MTLSINDFKTALGLNLPPTASLGSYLTPAELVAVKTASQSPMNPMMGQNTATSSQFVNMQALANNAHPGDPVADLQKLMESTPDAYKADVLARYGVSQPTWDKYWADASKSNAATSAWANDWYSPKDSNIRTPIDWLNMNAGLAPYKLKGMSDADLSKLLDNYNTYTTQKEGGGFMDAVGPLMTAVGMLSGNPWLGMVAGGLGSGLSTGDPVAGLLGAAGGYFGAGTLNSIADAGGIGNYLSNAVGSIGSALSHPLDTISGAASGLYDALSHPVDTLTNGILGTQHAAPIVDGSVGPTDIFSGGTGFNGSGPLTSLTGAGGNTGIDNLVSSAVNGTTPIMGIGTGALSGGQTINPINTTTNINVPTQAANTATNTLSNVAQNLVTNAITGALTPDTSAGTAAPSPGLLSNQFRPGGLGVTYPGLKSAQPFYTGRMGLLGSYI